MTIRRKKRLTEHSLYRFLKRSQREAKKCEDAQAYLAAMVLTGAALEYLFTAWIKAYPAVLRSSRRKLSDHWDLNQLITLARDSGFLDYKAFLAAQRIRKYRNLIHPNWYAGRKPLRFTKKLLDARLTDYENVISSIEKNL